MSFKTVGAEREVLAADIHFIAYNLYKSPNVSANLEMLYMALKLPAAKLYGLAQTNKNHNYNFLRAILLEWIQIYPAKATLESLCETLQSIELNHAADQISKNWSKRLTFKMRKYNRVTTSNVEFITASTSGTHDGADEAMIRIECQTKRGKVSEFRQHFKRNKRIYFISTIVMAALIIAAILVWNFQRKNDGGSRTLPDNYKIVSPNSTKTLSADLTKTVSADVTKTASSDLTKSFNLEKKCVDNDECVFSKNLILVCDQFRKKCNCEKEKGVRNSPIEEAWKLLYNHKTKKCSAGKFGICGIKNGFEIGCHGPGYVECIKGVCINPYNTVSWVGESCRSHTDCQEDLVCSSHKCIHVEQAFREMADNLSKY